MSRSTGKIRRRRFTSSPDDGDDDRVDENEPERHDRTDEHRIPLPTAAEGAVVEGQVEPERRAEHERECHYGQARFMV